MVMIDKMIKRLIGTNNQKNEVPEIAYSIVTPPL